MNAAHWLTPTRTEAVRLWLTNRLLAAAWRSLPAWHPARHGIFDAACALRDPVLADNLQRRNAGAAPATPESMTIETKTYSDGTTATGPAPLPDQSPRLDCSWPHCTCDPDGIDSPPCCADHAAEQSERIAIAGHLKPFLKPLKDDAGPIAPGWVLAVGPGHSGIGLYAYMEEYPEEGSFLLRYLSDVQQDSYAEGRKDEAEDWRTVAADGLPPCDGETVFVGINSNGFAACFNAMNLDGLCLMNDPEITSEQMSDLKWWRVLSRPRGEV